MCGQEGPSWAAPQAASWQGASPASSIGPAAPLGAVAAGWDSSITGWSPGAPEPLSYADAFPVRSGL